MQDRAHAGVAMRRTAGVAKSTRIMKIASLSPFPAAEDGRVDPTATFIKRFGDLVTLLRVDPGNDAAQDLALSAADIEGIRGGTVPADCGHLVLLQ